MSKRYVVFGATGIVLAIALAAAPQADDGNPKPAPPEVVKQLETPATISVDGTTMRYTGIIIEQSVAEFERLLKMAEEKNPIRALVINSPGGAGMAGIRFGEIVRDRKLVVTVDAHCMSACANYVALAAPGLFVPDGALLAFHGGQKKEPDEWQIESLRRILRTRGFPEQKIPDQLERLAEADRKKFARQQALFESVGASSAILEDTAPKGETPAPVF